MKRKVKEMKYEKPSVELIDLENVQDIICTSSGGGLNNDGSSDQNEYMEDVDIMF